MSENTEKRRLKFFFKNVKLASKNFTNFTPNISFILRFSWRMLQCPKSKSLLYYGGPLWPVILLPDTLKFPSLSRDFWFLGPLTNGIRPFLKSEF